LRGERVILHHDEEISKLTSIAVRLHNRLLVNFSDSAAEPSDGQLDLAEPIA